MERKSTVRQA